MRWRDEEVVSVSIISHWHVVLHLGWGMVELDPDDNVVRVTKRPEYYERVDQAREEAAAVDTDDLDRALVARGLDPKSVPRGADRLKKTPETAQGELFALITEPDDE
ncbi:MAG: hypothetical protein K0U16_07705 [Gammaproteobacteria bacterium]|nr:hypothetical protein [Gammaproteobacteria bacterium]